MNRRWIALAAAFAFAVAAHASGAVPDVGWTQRIGAPLPLQLKFFDESGRRVLLSDYFHGAPVVVVFAYLSCTRLCPEVLTGVDEVLRNTGLSAGRDYELLVLSIDPDEHHRSLRQNAHFLTSPGSAVSQVATAAGFKYMRAEQNQFAHGAGFLVATPSGNISRYFFGVRYPASEVKTALLAARDDRTGSLASRLLLLCYGLDGAHNERSEIIMTALRGLAIFGLIFSVAFGWRFVAGRGRPQ